MGHEVEFKALTITVMHSKTKCGRVSHQLLSLLFLLLMEWRYSPDSYFLAWNFMALLSSQQQQPPDDVNLCDTQGCSVAVRL